MATEANQEVKELQGSSDTEVGVVLVGTSMFKFLLLDCNTCFNHKWHQERLMDEVKVEDGEEGEMDEQGLAISVRRVRHFAYFTVYM